MLRAGSATLSTPTLAARFIPLVAVPGNWTIAGYVSLFQIVDGEAMIYPPTVIYFAGNARQFIPIPNLRRDANGNVFSVGWYASTVDYSPPGEFQLWEDDQTSSVFPNSPD